MEMYLILIFLYQRLLLSLYICTDNERPSSISIYKDFICIALIHNNSYLIMQSDCADRNTHEILMGEGGGENYTSSMNGSRSPGGHSNTERYVLHSRQNHGLQRPVRTGLQSVKERTFGQMITQCSLRSSDLLLVCRWTAAQSALLWEQQHHPTTQHTVPVCGKQTLTPAGISRTVVAHTTSCRSSKGNKFQSKSPIRIPKCPFPKLSSVWFTVVPVYLHIIGEPCGDLSWLKKSSWASWSLRSILLHKKTVTVQYPCKYCSRIFCSRLSSNLPVAPLMVQTTSETMSYSKSLCLKRCERDSPFPLVLKNFTLQSCSPSSPAGTFEGCTFVLAAPDWSLHTGWAKSWRGGGCQTSKKTFDCNWHRMVIDWAGSRPRIRPLDGVSGGWQLQWWLHVWKPDSLVDDEIQSRLHSFRFIGDGKTTCGQKDVCQTSVMEIFHRQNVTMGMRRRVASDELGAQDDTWKACTQGLSYLFSFWKLKLQLRLGEREDDCPQCLKPNIQLNFTVLHLVKIKQNRIERVVHCLKFCLFALLLCNLHFIYLFFLIYLYILLT